MRTGFTLRKLRPAYAVGVLTLVIPASAAAALGVARPLASNHPTRTTTVGATRVGATRATGVQRVAELTRIPIARIAIARPRAADIVLGETVNVRGRVEPGVAGRYMKLQRWSGRRWYEVARAATRRGGRFDLRYRPGGLGSEQLRVRSAGDGALAADARPVLRLTVFRETVASWYDDAGSTACGFHAGLGVANKTLPCGTRVTFIYAGRKVTAVVDDRGPFIPGREWDLNQNTAAALGMSGVVTLLSSR